MPRSEPWQYVVASSDPDLVGLERNDTDVVLMTQPVQSCQDGTVVAPGHVAAIAPAVAAGPSVWEHGARLAQAMLESGTVRASRSLGLRGGEIGRVGECV
eukprot:jgi/Ulvmu1/6515/UM003_0148.1